MAAPKCPCVSGRAYKECCAPFHRGAEPPDPTSLARARYSAFALGKIEFLHRTLDDDHPDRVKYTEGHILVALRVASSSLKYMGLELRDAGDADDDGIARVLYRARIFRKGADVSFVELAEFRHDRTGWRYLSGKVLDATVADRDPPARTIDAFIARAKE